MDERVKIQRYIEALDYDISIYWMPSLTHRRLYLVDGVNRETKEAEPRAKLDELLALDADEEAVRQLKWIYPKLNEREGYPSTPAYRAYWDWMFARDAANGYVPQVLTDESCG